MVSRIRTMRKFSFKVSDWIIYGYIVIWLYGNVNFIISETYDVVNSIKKILNFMKLSSVLLFCFLLLFSICYLKNIKNLLVSPIYLQENDLISKYFNSFNWDSLKLHSLSCFAQIFLFYIHHLFIINIYTEYFSQEFSYEK